MILETIDNGIRQTNGVYSSPNWASYLLVENSWGLMAKKSNDVSIGTPRNWILS